MSVRRRIRLTSVEMLNTPGLLAWAMNGYKFVRDRPNMIRVFRDGFNLPAKVADGLLSGIIPHEIQDDSVLFEADFPDDWSAKQ